MPTVEELGKSLLGTLNGILTGGDARVPTAPNSKISWCQPGIPFAPEDFQFAAQGLAGTATAEHLRLMQKQAYNFAMAVDFVPDVTGVYAGDQQQTMYRTSGARMSHMYGEILRFAKVVQTDPTAAEKEKLEKFRKLLYQEKTTRNLVTDEETTLTTPGPVLTAYNEAFSKYLEAATEYQSKRIQSLVATGPEGAAAVADFQFNGENYFKKVKAASERWISQGYKNEVEQMNAYINQVTQRSMALWKQSLLELYDRATITDADSNTPFKYTTIIPGNFASAPGWTGFSFNHEMVNATSSYKTSSWSGSAGLNFGLWGKASAAGTATASNSNLNITNFKMSFDLVQTVITRPWFYPEFFINRGWTLRKGEGWTYDQLPSDGAEAPTGNFIGYPTQAIFVRNLVIESEEFASAVSSQASTISGGGSVGYGPFSLSGKYSRGSGSTSSTMTRDGSKITVPGMQIIAFISHLIDKAPNPLPDIPEEAFQ